ncbi:Hypothetical predicted protein [Olea europaea subsp. europaea]|uniref:Uncharacterized protein n=1 Tax=Olea europaea subsp. europaea TaxID=158383 RepID=A0A8S0SIV7_OLEEU|nr:Hypothetical predicted protein [Olea europaea subsp. europaea]
MKRDGVSVTIVLAAVFAASILVVFIFGCFTDKKGTGSFYVNSEEEIKIPVVESIATPARTHIGEARAVLSSVNSSKFNPTALVAKRGNNKLEQVLASSRAAILKAASIRNKSIIFKNNAPLSHQIYRNPNAFYR